MKSFKWRPFFWVVFALLGGCPGTPPARDPLTSPPVQVPETVPPNALATARTSVIDELGNLDSPESFQRAIAIFEREEASQRLIPEERVVYGAVLLSQGRPQEARRQYQKALEGQPNNPEALRVLAYFARLDGNTNQQIELLRRWAAAYPQDPRPLAALGWAYLDQNKYEEARRYFNESFKHGRTAEALAGTSQINLRDNKNEEALANIDEAIKIEPDNDGWYAIQHQVLLKMERPQAAEEAISRAINLSPGDPWHLLDRARLRHRTLYRSEQAIEDLNRLLTIDPQNFFGRVYRAEILESQGKLEDSYKDYQVAYRIKPEYDPIYPSFALLSFVFEDFPTAIKMAEASFKQYPGEWAFPVIHALSLIRLQRQQEATQVLNRAVANYRNQELVQELFRFITNPRATFAMNTLLEREINEIVKTRVQFYLGYLYSTLGQAQSARAVWRVVSESRLKNIPEIAMARVMAGRP